MSTTLKFTLTQAAKRFGVINTNVILRHLNRYLLFLWNHVIFITHIFEHLKKIILNLISHNTIFKYINLKKIYTPPNNY